MVLLQSLPGRRGAGAAGRAKRAPGARPVPGERQLARGLVHMHGNFHLSGTLLAFMVILHFFFCLLCRRSASPPRNRNRKLPSASVSPGTAVGRGGSGSTGTRLSQRSCVAWAVPYHGGCDPTQ